MKKLLFFLCFLFFLSLNAQENKKYFKLNSNPENPNRKVNWDTEEIIILEKDSPVRTLGGANGKKSSGILPSGVAVVVDKQTKKSSWITICGNTDLTGDNWKPKGKIISNEKFIPLSELSSYLASLNLKGEKGDKGDQGLPGLNGRDGKDMENFTLQEKKSTLIRDLLGGIGTAILTGFAFQDEEINEIPGIKIQTGDGTYRFGPNKIETSRKFSWKNAGLGFLGGFLVFRIALN